MKQRYKYSAHLTSSQTNLHDLERDKSPAQEGGQPPYATLLGQTKNLEDPSTGYILKTDPLQVLIDQELKKQEYAKQLRVQMEENN